MSIGAPRTLDHGRCREYSSHYTYNPVGSSMVAYRTGRNRTRKRPGQDVGDLQRDRLREVPEEGSEEELSPGEGPRVQVSLRHGADNPPG